jgi:hypothetical protein
LSSALLFVAIVAIWAFVLVPAWLHRSYDVPAADLEGFTDASDGAVSAAAGLVPGQEPDREEPTSTVGPPAGAEPAAPASDPAHVAPAIATSRAAEPVPARLPTAAATNRAAPEPVPAPEPRSRFDPRPAPDPAIAHRAHSLRAEPFMSRARRRARVLQARRRALTTLVALTATAVGCALGGVAHWWITAPPVGMLGMYLLLLREAGRADGEVARRNAEAWAAHAAELRAREAEQAAQVPQPAADIIDISARVTDQFYDQYADAVVRAVGD